MIKQTTCPFFNTQLTPDIRVHELIRVMLMRSDDGRLLKLINTSRGRHQIDPVIVEVLRVFSRPVIHVRVHAGSATRRHSRHGAGRVVDDEQRDNGVEPREKVLVVASRVDIALLPLQRCHVHTSCRQASVSAVVASGGGGELPLKFRAIRNLSVNLFFVEKLSNKQCNI